MKHLILNLATLLVSSCSIYVSLVFFGVCGSSDGWSPNSQHLFPWSRPQTRKQRCVPCWLWARASHSETELRCSWLVQFSFRMACFGPWAWGVCYWPASTNAMTSVQELPIAHEQWISLLGYKGFSFKLVVFVQRLNVCRCWITAACFISNPARRCPVWSLWSSVCRCSMQGNRNEIMSNMFLYLCCKP